MNKKNLPTIDNIQLYELIGQGGFADVYKGKYLPTQELVAVKILRKQDDVSQQKSRQQQRFLRETTLYNQLKYPHIVTLIHQGLTQEEQLFAAFQYIDGITLKAYIAQHHTIQPVECLEIMYQVLLAVHFAHSNGVIHRDLKPENIMICYSSEQHLQVYVLDFGISALIKETQQVDNQLTLTKEMLGTPAYSAPEQLRGEAPTTATDIYSWGLVFLECLTGTAVFRGHSVAEIFQKQLSHSAIPIPAMLYHHPLGIILRDVLHKEPDKRQTTTEELINGLKGINVANLVSSHQPSTTLVQPLQQTYQQSDTAVIVLNDEFSTGNYLRTERRQITVLCLALEISFSNITEGSLELYDELQQDQQQSCVEIATQFGAYHHSTCGYLLTFLFGYPESSEDDARFAARTALEITTQLNQRSKLLVIERGLTIRSKIAIHTGIMLVGEDKHPNGMTINLATKLIENTDFGSISVTKTSQHLLNHYTELQDSKVQITNELQEAIPIFLLMGERHSEALNFLRPTSVSRDIVGRKQVLDQLQMLWQQTAEQQSTSVVLSGEGGIGKSRLVYELKKVVTQQERSVFICRGSSEYSHHAFYPFLGLIRQQLNLNHIADGKALLTIQKVCQSLATSPAIPELLASWLGLAVSNREITQTSDPEYQRHQLFELTLQLLNLWAEEQNFLLVIEDLQWCDAVTVQFIEYLQKSRQLARHLLLATTRINQGCYCDLFAEKIEIKRLVTTDVAEMVQAIVIDPIDHLAVRFIAERTDGIPLYVEELTFMLLDNHILQKQQGIYELETNEQLVPISLRDPLQQKINQLGVAKETIQLAATIGREFQYELLAATSPKSEINLQADLKLMLKADLVYRRRHINQENYIFRHALIRDTAYDSILEGDREQLHLQLAQTLELQFSELVTQSPYLIAVHWDKAHNIEKASEYYIKSAQKTAKTYANLEATQYYLAAIKLLKKQQNKALLAQSYHHLADCYILQGMHKKARTAYRLTLRFRVLPQLEIATIYRKLGKSYEAHHRHDMALKAYSRSELLLNIIKKEAEYELWWQEWLAIQSAKLYVYYWQGNVDKMSLLVTKVRPIIMQQGNVEQKAQFLDDVLHLQLRQYRYVVHQETLKIAKEAYELSLETKDKSKIAWAAFMVGFSLYFNTQHQRAIQFLKESLQLASQINDVTLQSRCYTYLTIIYRHLKDIELVDYYAKQALSISQQLGMDDYIAAAKANIAWCLWQKKDKPQAETLLDEALMLWHSLASQYPYPFQWLGYLLQLKLLIESDDDHHFQITTAINIILDKNQQQLPVTITEPLKKFTQLNNELRQQFLIEALKKANELGYL